MGRSTAAIDDYAARMKAHYDQLKFLDETDPEPWIEYTAYDLFTEEKKKFNEDGTLRPDFIEQARRMQLSQDYLERLEFNKMRDIEDFNQMSAFYAEKGINFGESQMFSRLSAVRDYSQNIKQLRQDLRNHEDIAELPISVEPDDYY